MLPLALQQSIDASIELETLRLSYKPGDVLKGVVKKVSTSNVARSVIVTIGLVGRIKTKATKSNGSDKSDSHYYGHADFCHGSTCIYQGPVEYGITTWPFTIEIPTALATDNPNPAVLEVHDIPPTFYTNSRERPGGSKRLDYLFCEYYLEAQVTDVSDRRNRPVSAIFPLCVRLPSSEINITTWETLIGSFENKVKTLHLDPEFAGKSLSFSQNLQSVFRRSTLPQYGYILDVELASVMQMENPDYISFRIRARSNQQETNKPSLIEKPPTLTLMAVSIRLEYSLRTGPLEGSYATADMETTWEELSRIDWEEHPGKPGMVIPNGLDEHTRYLDLGTSFGLRLTCHGLSCLEQSTWAKRFQPYPKPFSPSYVTGLMSCAYQLRWTIKVACAGKIRKIRSIIPVRVVGPSDDWEFRKSSLLGPQGVLKAHRDWTGGFIRAPVLV
jgi:hypothetical protein